MINKMLPYYGVIMKKRDVCTYPRYELEKGLFFEAYTPEWKEIGAEFRQRQGWPQPGMKQK